MAKDIILSTTYRGYELNKTDKADLGFYTRHLDSMIDLIEAIVSQRVFQSPRAYHLVLDEPSEDKLNEISNFLDREAKKISKELRNSISADIYYAIAHEKRTRKSGRHSHLYIFVDGWTGYDVEQLKRDLLRSGFSEKVTLQKRKPKERLGWVDVRLNADGEVVKVSKVVTNKAYHCMYTETKDLIERISYLAKVRTKQHIGRRPFTCSQLPKAKDRLGSNVILLEDFRKKAKQIASPSLADEELIRNALEAAWCMGLSTMAPEKNSSKMP